jgi:hypothetical protein
MTLPAVTLLADAEASALAGRFGVELDPSRCTIRVPVTTTVDGRAVPLGAWGFHVDVRPAVDAPVLFTDGEAIVFNASASQSSVQVTVTRNGRTCAPATHSTLVAGDGSVTIPILAGDWTVGPTMLCE